MLFSSLRNITARKAVEDQVRVSERRYRRLFEAAHDGILNLDPKTRKITDANPFRIEFPGYTHAELVVSNAPPRCSSPMPSRSLWER